MKKVLILSSSPRRGGNSDVLCDEFAKGAKEAGHEVDKIFLKDRKIGYCVGCNVCFGDGVHRKACFQRDDMAEILEKMLAADVIVLATPVYFYSMSAQLKTLIDRTVPSYTDMRNKEFYYILTAADGNEISMQRTVEALRGFTEDCLEGARECGIIYGLNAWHVGEIQGNPAMRKSYEAGKNV